MNTDKLIEAIARAFFNIRYDYGSESRTAWDNAGRLEKEEHINAVRFALTEVEAAGYRLVPVEPATDMEANAIECEAMIEADGDQASVLDIWAAMLAAAPEASRE